MNPEVNLAVVRLPGRENRVQTPAIDNMDELIEQLVPIMVDQFDGRPYALFGSCLGALISFEVARRIMEMGAQLPRLLCIAGASPPQTHDVSRRVTEISDSEFLAKLREIGGTPPEVFDNSELVELLLPLLRSDFKLGQSYAYRAGPPLPVPILAVCGQADHALQDGEVTGWAMHTRTMFATYTIQGDHFSIFSNSLLPTLIGAALIEGKLQIPRQQNQH